MIAATASYVYGKFEWEIDTKWLKARLRDAIDKAPKRAGRDVSNYLRDSYLNQNIGTATSKFCQVVTTPKFPAPQMTPEQARGEIKSSLWAIVDRYFEALSDWEIVNGVYQDGYAKLYDRAEATIKSGDLEFDAVELARETRKASRGDPEFESLEHPGHQPQEILSLAVGVGLGKTEQALKLIKYVRDKARELLISDVNAEEVDKLSRDTRVAYKRLTRAVLAVPTHSLADEAAERVRGLGLSAGTFRGRLFKVTETGRNPMCNRPDDVERCVEARLPIESSMCRNGANECEFRRSCGYYQQMEDLYSCDVVVVPHASLFHKKPAINSRGLLIIDEQFAFAGERQRRALLVSELRKNKDKVHAQGEDGQLAVDAELTDKLHRYREDVAADIIESADGNLGLRSVSGLRPQDVAEAIKLEWQTVVQSPVYPGMSKKRLLEALASAPRVKQMRLRVDFWEALLALANSDGKRKSGWLIRDTNADGRVVVWVGGRATIKEGWSVSITICLDATSSSDLVRLYFPKQDVVVPTAIEAIQPNVTVLQTIDKAFSASMCIPADGLSPEELQRRENRAREVYRFIRLRASEFLGQGREDIDVLVICQQALEKHLVDLGLPDNVEIAHFNAIRGINKWGGVRCLITVGRTLPSPRDVEVLTENLTGWAVEKLPESIWYPRPSMGINIGNGIGLPTLVERHPDPMVEVVRQQICEAELIQAGGRGRGVNRLRETPLQLDVLSNVCLPIEVDQPIRWDDNAPGKIEEMVSMGLLPEGPAAAALVFPELWTNKKSASNAAANARAIRSKLSVLDMCSTEQLKGLNPLLISYSREKRPFSPEATNSPLLGSIDILAETWGLKPLALGALSRMVPCQAKVFRPNKRALKIKFLFDPRIIPDVESWLSKRSGSSVEVEFVTSNNLTSTRQQHHRPISSADQLAG